MIPKLIDRNDRVSGRIKDRLNAALALAQGVFGTFLHGASYSACRSLIALGRIEFSYVTEPFPLLV
jgi:hypothetical protein